MPRPLPADLHDEWYFMDSLDWWRGHWARYPGIEVERCEMLEGGRELWVRWLEFLQASGRANHPDWCEDELQQLRTDSGRYIGFARMVGRRRAKTERDEPAGAGH
jgi:hypothetical protein